MIVLRRAIYAWGRKRRLDAVKDRNGPYKPVVILSLLQLIEKNAAIVTYSARDKLATGMGDSDTIFIMLPSLRGDILVIRTAWVEMYSKIVLATFMASTNPEQKWRAPFDCQAYRPYQYCAAITKSRLATFVIFAHRLNEHNM